MPSRRPWWRSQWLPTAVAVVPTLLTLWSVSPPGGYFGVALLAFACWLLAWVVWLVVAALAAVALPQPRRRHVRTLWPLLALPVLLVAASLSVTTGMVQHMMFEAHRGGLARLVADVAAAPGQRLTDQWVGLYAVQSAAVDRDVGCTMITLRDAGFFSSSGFAYCPDRPPIDDDVRGGEGTTYEPFDGPWHTFTFIW